MNDSVNKRGILKINNHCFQKVSICGLIVGIYESVKFYRLKVDDSTGCVNVTLWKSSIFNENSIDHLPSTNSYENRKFKENFNNLYEILNSIKSRIKDATINNLIMYEPKQGDLVAIRGNVKFFRDRIDLNAVSCQRIKNSADEMTQMVLPSILSRKVYSLPETSLETFNSVKRLKDEKTELWSNAKTEFKMKDDENFINLVNKKLIQLASKSDSNQTMSHQSCESYELYTFLKNNCPNEFKMVTYKQVLDALKELELRGLVYSCEDELHYLPMI